MAIYSTEMTSRGNAGYVGPEACISLVALLRKNKDKNIFVLQILQNIRHVDRVNSLYLAQAKEVLTSSFCKNDVWPLGGQRLTLVRDNHQVAVDLHSPLYPPLRPHSSEISKFSSSWPSQLIQQINLCCDNGQREFMCFSFSSIFSI